MDLFNSGISEIDSAEDHRAKAKRRRSVQRSISEKGMTSAKVPDRERKAVRDVRASGKRAKEGTKTVMPEKNKITFRELSSAEDSFLKGALAFTVLAILVVVFLDYAGTLEPSDTEVSPITIKKIITQPPAPKKPSEKGDEKGAPFSEIYAAKETPPENPQIQEQPPAPATPFQPEETKGSEPLQRHKVQSYPYSIYLGSYRSLDGAKEIVSVYQAEGLSAYWVKVNLGNKGIWYRIFTGYFGDRELAEAFLNERKLTGGSVRKTKYSNLIGVYSSKEALGNKSLILSKLGYSPYVIPGVYGKELHIGAFYAKEPAESQYQELSFNGIQSKIVER